MALLDVSGVPVSFPFQPYPCQVTYMEKVLQCLQKEQNGVLESPTGTGKTLCLLCSSLAWLESRKAQVELSRQAGAAALMAEASKENMEQSTLAAIANSLQRSTGSASSSTWGSNEFVVPKVIYASRTHSQLSQAVQELKRTAYSSVKTAIIGSREQLCINEQVKKETNNSTKVHLCRAKVAARRCHYYNVYEDLKRSGKAEGRQIVGNITDIEDLVSHGMKSKICPYYLARELKSDADIIFMPYNYLLDPKSRKAHGVELQGNIIIFDEAHNLERICEESASFDLSSVDVATAIEETTQLGVRLTELVSAENDAADMDEAVVPEFTLEDIIKLKKTLLELEELVDSEPLKNNEVTKPGMFMFELMAKVNITFQNKMFVIDLLDKMISHFNSDGTSSALHSKGAGLTKVADAIKIIFNQEPREFGSVSQHKESLAQHYKVHIQQKDSNNQRKKKIDSWTAAGASDKTERVLSYWCFSPGYSMQELKDQGVKCVILTSGTLSPLDSFTAEMQVPFPVRLENPHVIEKHQVWVGTLACGPDGATLNSNYHNRFTESYQSSLGNSIVNFARVVPDGLLVFFPSYPVMEKCVETWQGSNIWDRIMAHKPVVLEPRGKDAFTQAIDDFYEKINDKQNGAVFMAVCRGKVSEGLDFADMNGRAVMLTGLPFPPMKDPRVILKMQHLDSLRGKQGHITLSGQQWYRQQATRAVNQAIGRVIRHKNDFGAIILCDTRFSSPESVNGLPMWVKPYVSKYDSFGRAVRDMLNFFKVAERMMPAPEPRQGGKKAVSAVGKGCVGAYFEPTVTRHVSGMEQASNVTCHLPGLSDQASKNQEEILAKLQSQYSGPNQDGARKRGLFHALDMEKGAESYLGASGSETAEPKGSVKIHTKRRKIIIKPKGLSSGASSLTKAESGQDQSAASGATPQQPAASSKTRGRATQAHHSVAENYLAQVKAALSQEQYKRFSATLLQYKKSGSLQAVTPTLADLFTSHADLFPLFHNFYRFVRPAQKAEFDQLCVSLTGVSCGYKPEHALTGKRLVSSADTAGCRDTQSKLTSACMKPSSTTTSSSALGKWTASSVASTSHSSVSVGSSAAAMTSSFISSSSSSSTAVPNGALQKQKPPASSSSFACEIFNGSDSDSGATPSLQPSSSSHRDPQQEKPCSGSSVSLNSKTCRTEDSSKGGSVVAGLSGTTSHTQSAESSQAQERSWKHKANDSDPESSFEVSWDQERPSSSQASGPNTGTSGSWGTSPGETDKAHFNRAVHRSGHTCRQCSQEASVPFQLRECGHVCCFKCWRTVLQGDKQCPGGCGQSVKRRHLKQLLCASGDNIVPPEDPV